MSDKSYTCLKVEQNNFTVFICTIPVDEIFPYCYVDPFEKEGGEPSDAGYQRLLDMKRAEDIAHYVTEGHGCIPNSIVLVAQESASLEYSAKNKLIHFQRHPRAFAISDGQHRMWGFEIARTKHDTNHRVILSIVPHASKAEEARLFVDINDKQRGVPAALLLRVKQRAGTETTRETTLRELYDRLASDESSPLYGLTSPARTAVGKITSLSFNRAMSRVLHAKVFEGCDEEKRYRIWKNYLGSIRSNLEASYTRTDEKHGAERARSLFVKANFFGALCDVIDDVAQATLAHTRSLKRADFATSTEFLCDVSYELPDGKLLTRVAMADAMRATLRSLDMSDVAV